MQEKDFYSFFFFGEQGWENEKEEEEEEEGSCFFAKRHRDLAKFFFSFSIREKSVTERAKQQEFSHKDWQRKKERKKEKKGERE